MANTIRLVEYFYLTASDKPGEAVRALNILMSDGKSDLYLLRLQKRRLSRVAHSRCPQTALFDVAVVEHDGVTDLRHADRVVSVCTRPGTPLRW